jgi:hypothetical protein
MGLEAKTSAICALLLVEIFPGHIVFGNFVRVNFLFLGLTSSFHATDHVGLKRVPFLEKLIDTL